MTKKPLILKDKIEVAKTIKEKWKRTDNNFQPMHGYYWDGYYTSPSGQLSVYIYFQRYCKGHKKMNVNYVRMTWQNEDICDKPVLPQEIKTLLKSFTKKDFR